MSKRACFVILLIILFGCSGQNDQKTKRGSSVPFQKEAPVLEFTEEIHNFGTLRSGEIVLYTFVYKNTGKGKLEISEVESGCGCLTVEPLEKTVLPGETGRIRVVFQTAGLFGTQFQAFRVLFKQEGIEMHLAVAAEVLNEDIEYKQP